MADSFIFLSGFVAGDVRVNKVGEKKFLNLRIKTRMPWKGSDYMFVPIVAKQDIAADMAADLVDGQWVQIKGTLVPDKFTNGVQVLVESYGI